MGNYRHLPFAVYDLAVYLPGGAVILVLLANLLNLSSASEILTFQFADAASVNTVIEGLFWLSASYLTGHLAAFLSTYVVEKPMHNFLGYPAEVYALQEEIAKEGRGQKEFRSKQRKRMRRYEWSLSSIAGLILNLPIIFHVAVFTAALPLGFYRVKIPVGYEARLFRVMEKIGVSRESLGGHYWPKFAEHYVANKYPSAFSRMYNYLVIYGALRLLALIVLVITYYTIYLFAKPLWNGPFTPNSLSLCQFIQVAICSTLYFFTLMAFGKFYRRYFEESVLALLIHADEICSPAAASQSMARDNSGRYSFVRVKADH